MRAIVAFFAKPKPTQVLKEEKSQAEQVTEKEINSNNQTQTAHVK